MEQIQISAKVLGQMAMPDFCPRCFWIKLKVKKLPWQIFPGIFSSIDAYSKKIVHALIDRANVKNIPLPDWLSSIGDIVGHEKVPHWSKFNILNEDTNIVLSGVPDDILLLKSGQKIIPDYKTAKYTENQDKLFPMYEVQLNAYAKIAAQTGDIAGIPLVYFEPQTSDEQANDFINQRVYGFSMPFSAHVVSVEINTKILDPLLERAREINNSPIPGGSCKDCLALEDVVRLGKGGIIE